jgi:hypothetical protein
LNRSLRNGMMRRPGFPRRRSLEVLAMQRRWAAAVVLGVLASGSGTFDMVGPAGASGSSVAVKVTPHTGLVGGQYVTVSGRGLVRTYHGAAQTWFITECTSSVQGRMKASTDTLHCNITHAKTIHLGPHDTFTTRYRLATGIIGDGYCGTTGHLSCVIGVGTADNLGTVVRITFKNPFDLRPP